MTIRVLLADDQTLLRATFRILIDSSDDIHVVAEAADGHETIKQARAHRPDVIVMDIHMPGLDGLAATTAIREDPDLSATRVLILTTFETEEYVARALRAGASGFLGKDASVDELLTGIRTVVSGETLLSPQATRALVTHFLTTPEPDPGLIAHERLTELTPRERETMSLAAAGLSNPEIAEKLFISPFTVRTHIVHAMAKLDARDRTQLVVIAYQTGLVRPAQPKNRALPVQGLDQRVPARRGGA